MEIEQIGALAGKSAAPTNDTRLREVAQELEASFLSEMLKYAGLGETGSAFGGGHGEDQFASLLRDEQAHQIVQAGGLGLTESLFESLKDRQND